MYAAPRSRAKGKFGGVGGRESAGEGRRREEGCQLTCIDEGQGVQMAVSMATLGLIPVSPARDRQSLTELFALPKKVASWSHQGHGKSTELLGGRQTETQSIASSAFLKAINSHLSCSIDLPCETAASVIFF